MSTTYKVVAPLVLVRDETGATHHVYQGGEVVDLEREQVDHLLALGFIAKAGSDDAVIVPGTEFLDEAQIAQAKADAPIDAPAKVATKEIWVDYAVAKGADRAEAEALTKAELVELYG